MVNNSESFPFMVIGNKVELEDERVISTDQAKEWCQQQGDILFIETSAATNQKVSEAFIQLATQALRRQQEMAKQLEKSLD